MLIVSNKLDQTTLTMGRLLLIHHIKVNTTRGSWGNTTNFPSRGPCNTNLGLSNTLGFFIDRGTWTNHTAYFKFPTGLNIHSSVETHRKVRVLIFNKQPLERLFED
eukprot:Lithocolla_globosa_v1_NODE_1455_length_2561_cov_332.847167.p3 type:complete len:106 gc:universal NODE_1455_length_2561_cov_332.847167:841-1158(+)